LKLKKFLFILIVIISINLPVKSCTLWGSAGSTSKDGITLVTKNRDWKPDNKNELWLIKPEKGFKFLALYAIGGENEGIKGGINEKGLVVLTATASTLPKEERMGEKISIAELLTTCDSVDSVLEKKEMFGKPFFYITGDKTKIAVIEIGQEGTCSVRETENGILYHTNHYLYEHLIDFNKKENESSQVRYNRIKDLMEHHKELFRMEDFIEFSSDIHDGPDNSIWRTGSTPEKPRTLGSLIVAIPKDEPPVLYIKTANPGEEEKTEKMILDEDFWNRQ
jgi:hypothetical protein